MANVVITYRKSAIGYKQDQKDTIKKLGFRRLGQSITKQDTPDLRGMLFKVVHLVDVREEASE
ncbi:MAG: 50S ribosomal protein L30 [Dehalococcoidia bacterium]